MAKRPLVARDVDEAEECLIACLEECRDLVAKFRDGKVDKARVKLAKEAVESAEQDLHLIRRKYGEQNAKAAGEALGCEVVLGART